MQSLSFIKIKLLCFRDEGLPFDYLLHCLCTWLLFCSSFVFFTKMLDINKHLNVFVWFLSKAAALTFNLKIILGSISNKSKNIEGTRENSTPISKSYLSI